MASESRPKVLCVGAATIDTTFRLKDELRMATSNPATACESIGGVAANVARNLVHLGNAASLVAVLGDDDASNRIAATLNRAGVDTSLSVVVKDALAARYSAILDPDGDLTLGVASMDINDALSPEHFERVPFEEFAIVFADCNIPGGVLDALRQRRFGGTYRFAVDAVSEAKILHLRGKFDGIDVFFANYGEAHGYFGLWRETARRQLAKRFLDEGAATAVLMAASEGAYVATPQGQEHIQAVPATIVDATGAGDAFVAGTIHELLRGTGLENAVRTGTVCASLTLESEGSVRDDLSPELVQARAAAETHA